MNHLKGLVFFLLVSLINCQSPNNLKTTPYAIQIIDEETGKGIPMVEVKTLNAIVYHTDNTGYISFFEPDLMGLDLYFELKSSGYAYPKDKAGRQGITLAIVPGQDTVLKMQRTNLAERLYRITGSGKTVHQDALNKTPRERNESLKGGVLGQDSNLSIPYRGKIFWAWGDSFLPSEYQGNFSVSAAWSTTPNDGGWSPEDGIEFNYITDERGLSKPMINLNAPGYVWFDWLMTMRNQHEHSLLVAKYARVNAFFGNYERGIAVFNEEKEVFERHLEIDDWLDELHTCQHPFLGKSKGREYYYFTSEFNFSRVVPNLDSVSNPSQYEHFNCLVPGTENHTISPKLERDASGKLIYGWKKNTSSVGYTQLQELVKNGIITPQESFIQTQDILTGEPINVGRGSIFWNEFRQRWILIAGNKDVWYSEADTPVGPWVYVQKIAAHDHYFYNPVHHYFLDLDEGRRIYFEGTFTKFFSPEPAVPRYDYNQLMYGLNLDHPGLIIPVPVYQLNNSKISQYGLRPSALENSSQIKEIPFFALDHSPKDESIIAIYQKGDGSGQLTTSNTMNDAPLFYAVDPGISMNQLFVGEWESKIQFKSFDNSVTLSIEKNNHLWIIKPSKSSFQASNLQIVNDSLKLDLEHEGDNYQMIGQVKAGKIEGFFTNIKTNSSGNWTAIKRQSELWVIHGPNLLSLYEFKRSDGTYHYSLEKLHHPNTQYKFIKILCKVWRNPTDVLTFDFDTRPVN